MPETPGKTPDAASKWAVFKDRLSIGLAIAALLLLLFFMFDGTIMNFQCSFTEFLSFKCSRYDARPRSWNEITHRD
jgi:hypothetical protein